MYKVEARKSINDSLEKYDTLAKKDSFIEITQWTNGEGIDININDKYLSLTYGELDAINHLNSVLNYSE